MATISSRKDDHIRLCLDGDVGFRQKTTLLEEVELLHDALPELAMADIDLRSSFVGKSLSAPLIIAAMTGGTDRAETINRDLAAAAQRLGLGFAFGSQRPYLVKGISAGYKVRDVAPDILILGNIGLVQARETPTQQLKELLDFSGADALCVHLNPAMEVVQPEGDNDFRHGLPTIRRLVEELDRPIIVKETGCGLSRSVGQRVVELGVGAVDVSGAGGTSWVAVETGRAQSSQRALGERFWDWGIPTAASVAQLSGLGLEICATGGIQSGLDVAKALALGATIGGIARPLLQAHAAGRLDEKLQEILAELRVAHLLAGAQTPRELAEKPVLLESRLRRWVPADSPLRARMIGG